MRIVNIAETQETLQDAVARFINYKKAQGISARTLRDYESYLSHFVTNSSNSLDEKTLTQDVLQYFAQIPNTSPARFNHPYQNLSSFFNWAIAQDYLRKNPLTAQGLHKKRDDGNIKPANLDDIKTLLNSFNKTTFAGLRNYVITLVMIDTGIRTSELIRLKDVDYDAAAKQITISKHISKTRRNRVVYLTDTTAKQLERYMRIKPAGWTEYLFPTREGSQLATEGLDREFSRQCAKIGVKVTPYQFRHTFATYFVASGGDIFTLQDIMGHADIRMTRRYTEIDDTQRKKQHSIYSPINALQGNSRLVKI